jgi:hypothetical protein
VVSRRANASASDLGRPVQPDPFQAAAVSLGHGDVNRAGSGWVGEELVEVRGGFVAERRRGSAGEDRGHLIRVGEDDRTDQIHATKQRPQPATSHPAIDLVRRHPELEELPPRDHSVLATRQGPDSQPNVI